MNRYLLVARHEFMTQLRRPVFLFMAFIFPILISGVSLLPSVLLVREAQETGTLGDIGYVDEAGVLVTAVQPEDFVAYDSAADAAVALQDEAIGAYFVLANDYRQTGQVDAYTMGSIPEGIEDQLDDFIRDSLLADKNAQLAERMQNPAELVLATLDGSRRIDESTAFLLFIVPVVFAIVFGLSINLTSSFMMQNVVEEKETRMVEMMITSIRPVDLLWGKILGLSALGLLQMTFWVVIGGAAFIIREDWGQQLAAVALPWWLILYAIVYLLLGYVLYGSLLSGIGASTSSMQEAQSLAAVFSLLAIAPMFMLVTFLRDPNGFWPITLSFFPFTAPTAMMIRLSLTAVPWWHVVLSMGILIGVTAGVVWLAVWVFRIGLLMTGKRLGLRTLWQVMRSGRKEWPVAVAKE